MKMRTCEEAFYIMKVVKEWKEKIEECTVGACIDYLEKVFDIVIRGVKGKVVKLDLGSMETPRWFDIFFELEYWVINIPLVW